jgi:3-hydroxybutyryl-CoA dehydrogenase
MIRKILIAGSGQVGSEIGFFFAMRGLDVVMYDVFEASLALSRTRHAQFAQQLAAEGGLGDDTPEQVLSRLTYEADIAKAAVDVDFVSESVTEVLDVKRSTYEALSRHCPPKTIFTSNTSTMLASEIAGFTDRPASFLACHVARPIWARPMFEIMPHPGTDPALVEKVTAFARSVGLVPIRIAKEHPAYVSNSLIASFVTTALDLAARGVASYEDIDRVWMIGTEMKMGPIGMVDMMGIGTVHFALTHLAENGGRSEFLPIVKYLKDNFVDQGKQGVVSGEGFYKYPNPDFEQPDFLQ